MSLVTSGSYPSITPEPIKTPKPKKATEVVEVVEVVEDEN